MIELSKERLPIAIEKKLRSWLSRSESNLLRRVVSAKGQFKQADALSEATQAGDSGEAQELLSRASMREARRYATFLEVLNEIASQPAEEPFQTARLKATDYAIIEPIGDGQYD